MAACPGLRDVVCGRQRFRSGAGYQGAEHLGDHYQLQIIDVYQTPVLAVSENIVATPTLVLPAPLRRVIGNLSHERVMLEMQLLDLVSETKS
jgi:hypothetical protein